jgi:hypothetical protein
MIARHFSATPHPEWESTLIKFHQVRTADAKPDATATLAGKSLVCSIRLNGWLNRYKAAYSD